MEVVEVGCAGGCGYGWVGGVGGCECGRGMETERWGLGGGEGGEGCWGGGGQGGGGVGGEK